MNAIELMVGDFVMQKHSGLILQVSGINPPYITAVGEGGQFHEDTIKPILLTKEILERSGFIYSSGMCYCYADYNYDKNTAEITITHINSEVNNCQIHIEDLNYPGTSPTLHLMECNYVHHLQHILRDCDIDKEITL